MARKYDVESLVQDIETLLKAKLNAAVAAVEAEQIAAGLPASDLLPVDQDGYFQFDWTSDSLNKKVGVGIFVADQQTDGQGAYSSQRFVIDVGVYLSGTNNDRTATRKLIRYSKALRNVFEDRWTYMNSGFTKEKVETVGPVDFKLNVDSSDDCKIAGVTIACTLG
jgi:hypothetical protein